MKSRSRSSIEPPPSSVRESIPTARAFPVCEKVEDEKKERDGGRTGGGIKGKGQRKGRGTNKGRRREEKEGREKRR